MKKTIALFLCAVLCGVLLCGCTETPKPETSAVVSVDSETSSDPGPGRYEETYYDVFDTVCTFIAYTDSEAQFQEYSKKLHEYLLSFHKLYDVYNEYDGITNLRTVNLTAAEKPVIVDGRILDLLELGKTAYTMSNGKVNVAYGATLSLWNTMKAVADEDEVFVLPNEDALAERAVHSNIDDVVINRDDSTVYIKDASLKLDVGAVGKGFAAQCAREYLIALGVTSGALNMGGTVCVIGVRQEDGAKWSVGIADPDGNGYIRSVEVKDQCVVTSGDYERFYEVEGVRYCHLIDPDTNYPARTFRSTSVIGNDAGLCDALSTALFLMPLDEGRALIEKTENVEAFWILADGSTVESSGFSALSVKENDETDE